MTLFSHARQKSPQGRIWGQTVNSGWGGKYDIEEAPVERPVATFGLPVRTSKFSGRSGVLAGRGSEFNNLPFFATRCHPELRRANK